MIILALIILLVLILFLTAIVASAITGERRELYVPVEKRTLPRAREPVRDRPRTDEPVKNSGASIQPKRGLYEDPVAYFRAIGRVTPQGTTDADVHVAYEGFFASANQPFKGGGRNDRKGAICFLTGQPKDVCECAECANRRRSG